MGVFSSHRSSTSLHGASGTTISTSTGSVGTAYKPRVPPDRSTLAFKPEACHCVSDSELENRYNLLRAEEHARTEGKCGPDWSRTDSAEPDVCSRNRYGTIVPWNHSRVRLPVEPGRPDYINASWIQLGSRVYIASQGPLPGTIRDFWHMVYAYGGEPAVVIMLTACYEHAVEKCAKYWPDVKGQPMRFPREKNSPYKFGLDVHLESLRQDDHYSYSMFKLVPSDPQMPVRHVHHVYYHTWLDYSKPNTDADLRALVHLVNNKLRNPGAPPIVHCSAGIGRTGTFIAVDALLSKIDPEIEPSNAPKVSPVWAGPQDALWYKETPFTGPPGEPALRSSMALRSKFDMSMPSSPAHSSPSTPTTAQSISNEVIDGKRVLVDGDAQPRKSLLTEKLRETECEDALDRLTDITPPPSSKSNGSNGSNSSSTTNEPMTPEANNHASGSAETGDSLQSVSNESNQSNGSAKSANDSSLAPLLETEPCTCGGEAESIIADRQRDPSPTSQTPSSVATSSVAASSYTGSAKTGPVLGRSGAIPASVASTATMASSANTSGVNSVKIGSALSGPPVRHIKAKTTNVSEEVLRESPDRFDVFRWFDPEDPVMSAVRCIRKQRPKMVQGKQQLGYIYDQFEVAQQLARVYTPEHINSIRRRSTMPSSLGTPSTPSLNGTSAPQRQGSARDKRSPSGASDTQANGSHRGIKGLLRARSISAVFNNHTQASSASTSR